MEDKSSASPLVSVWMITYNHEKYIAQAIEGVLMQKTNFKIELVIGEDCSTDNTAKIVKEYAKKYPEIIIARYNKPNMGMIPNMIKTLEECSGKYVAMCEGDDYWTDPCKLQKQVDFLEKNEEYNICFHPVHINKNGNLVEDFLTRDVQETSDIFELAKGNFMHTLSVVFRRDWDQLPNWILKSPIGDYPLHMTNALNGKIKKLPQKMGVYRIHEKNSWVNQDKMAMSINIHNYLDVMIGNFPKEIENILIQRYLNVTFGIIQSFYNNAEYEKASFYLKKIMDKIPISLTQRIIETFQPQPTKYHLSIIANRFKNKIKRVF